MESQSHFVARPPGTSDGLSWRPVRLGVIGVGAILGAAVVSWMIPTIYYQRMKGEREAAVNRVRFLERSLKRSASSYVKQISDEKARARDLVAMKDREIEDRDKKILELQQRVRRIFGMLDRTPASKPKGEAPKPDAAQLEKARRDARRENGEAEKRNGAALRSRYEALERRYDRLEEKHTLAVPALIRGLGSSDLRSRTAFSRVLTILTGKAYGTDRKRWQRWWDELHPGGE
jgi:hypothetical protein